LESGAVLRNEVLYHINLLNCTVNTTFSARILEDSVINPTQRFIDTRMVPLGQALMHAGKAMKHRWGNDSSMEQDLKLH
jgi:hypothetical protein